MKTYIVDAFTDQPFKGNQAGVCLIKDFPADESMLAIANELGFSETAFVRRQSDDRYSIRYFSPKMEIALCGHATLASSKVLFQNNEGLQKLSFVTGKDVELKIARQDDWIIMEFPLYDTEKAEAPQVLLRALGITEVVNTEFNRETRILLVEIPRSEVLRALKPDFKALFDSHTGINGVLVTAASSNEKYDFESRYFWPWSGTNEDPVTGGIHTFLTPYWSNRLGKTKMRSFQCSERTGFMEVEVLPNRTIAIKSKAQIILEGRLHVNSIQATVKQEL